MDDLSPFELEQIARLETKVVDARHKSAQASAKAEDKFKEVALAITQLYTIIASSQGPEAYNAFKHAACKLTEFYNETKEAKTNEHACGYTTKEREMIKWAKSRKKHGIRRDDLIANITGSSPPHRTHQTFARRDYSRSRGSPQRRSPRPSTSAHRFRGSDVSHIQERMENGFTMSSPPRSDRKRHFQLFDEAVNASSKRTKYS